jgi:hypothetical protein
MTAANINFISDLLNTTFCAFPSSFSITEITNFFMDAISYFDEILNSRAIAEKIKEEVEPTLDADDFIESAELINRKNNIEI